MEQTHGNPSASIVLEFPNSLIPEFLDLFRAPWLVKAFIEL